MERQKEARRGGCRLSWDHLSSRRGGGGEGGRGVTRHPRLALLCLHMGGCKGGLGESKVGLRLLCWDKITGLCGIFFDN